MNARKTLGPPRGAEQTSAAAKQLAARFNDDTEPGPPAEPAPVETKRRRPPGHRRSRGEPDGMTRRTLYLPTGVADALVAAADDIAAAYPPAPRHQILTALLRHGLDHIDDARTDVRQQLIDSLTPE